MPGWLWSVLVVGVVVGALAVSLKIVQKRAATRRADEQHREFERQLQQRDNRRAALAAAQEACGLWSWWRRNLLEGGEVYTLSEHDIPRETKEEREGWYQDGLWLAQTSEHGGSYFGCAVCKQRGEAHIEDVTHDRFGDLIGHSNPIGYTLPDGTRHVITVQPKPGWL